MTRRPESDYLVLICTYNERENLPKLFQAVRQVCPESDILVVDDNSPDQTAQWVREEQKNDPKVHLIQRTGKLGLGSAIKTGMLYAIEQGYPWLINLDGDLSHDPAVIPDLLAKKNSYDLVIGSRYVPGGGLKGCSWRRIALSKFANQLARAMVGWSIRDCSSAYRLYRIESIQKIQLHALKETGYGFLEEVLAHLIKAGARIAEVPIVYQERQLGKSKISLKEARSAFNALRNASKIYRSIK